MPDPMQKVFEDALTIAEEHDIIQGSAVVLVVVNETTLDRFTYTLDNVRATLVAMSD